MVNLPAGSVRPEDVGSAVRFVIAWGVGVAGIKLSDGELNDITMIVATAVAFLLTWLWSRAKNRKLLNTEPPEDAAKWKAIAERYAAAQNLPRPDESRAEFDARVGNPAPGSSSRIGPVVALALTAGVMCLGMIGMGGCQAVGPVRTVGTVQTSNDPLNASSVRELDENGIPTLEWNDSTNGPVSTVKQTGDLNLVRKTGQVTREISWRSGDNQVLVSTGADLAAKNVSVDPATGVISIGEFTTSSSEPIRALNESLDRYQAVWATLSEDQRAAIEAQFDAIKVISPDLFDVLKAAIGLP